MSGFEPKTSEKSDLDKKWMKKRLDRAIKIQPEYHLIVTEGTDTEPEYFGSIKDVINKKYPEKIKLDVYGEGDNTISLFQKAKTRAEESSNVYKHVWIVYDTDDFPADHIDSVLQSCDTDSNDETTFHCKLRSNGMPVPLLRNCYSIFNGTKYR